MNSPERTIHALRPLPRIERKRHATRLVVDRDLRLAHGQLMWVVDEFHTKCHGRRYWERIPLKVWQKRGVGE